MSWIDVAGFVGEHGPLVVVQPVEVRLHRGVGGLGAAVQFEDGQLDGRRVEDGEGELDEGGRSNDRTQNSSTLVKSG